MKRQLEISVTKTEAGFLAGAKLDGKTVAYQCFASERRAKDWLSFVAYRNLANGTAESVVSV